MMQGGMASEHFFRHLFAGVFSGPPHSSARTFAAAHERASVARCSITAFVSLGAHFFVTVAFFFAAEKILPAFSSAFQDSSPPVPAFTPASALLIHSGTASLQSSAA